MNILLVPGNNKSNRLWINQVAKAVSPFFSVTISHSYEHWRTNRELIDFDLEGRMVAKAALGLEPFKVFAKSIGVLVALKLIADKKSCPVSCIFVGFPLMLIEETDFSVESWLQKAGVPITFIQNDLDPMGSYAAVKQYVDSLDLPNINFVKLSGDTHSYSDIGLLTTYILDR